MTYEPDFGAKTAIGSIVIPWDWISIDQPVEWVRLVLSIFVEGRAISVPMELSEVERSDGSLRADLQLSDTEAWQDPILLRNALILAQWYVERCGCGSVLHASTVLDALPR